ncbi:MAG: two-partner secretion domain-containing protein [Gammaproteobacteria bacterium]
MSKSIPICLSIILTFSVEPHSYAGVVIDGSFGHAGAVAGPNYDIRADLGYRAGNNLFHSFSVFDIGSGESALFSGPSAIENIISRVTGGSPSTIDGLIQSTIPGVDLYLINPHGILFEKHASLDVGGSFHASTADYLKLSDGVRFNAIPTQHDALLTAASPMAFGFLEAAPAPITLNESALEVGEGGSISLIGGAITVKGTGDQNNITAPSGGINLISAASAGEAVFERHETGLVPVSETFTEYGDITASQDTFFQNFVTTGNSGGKVYIRSGRLTFDGGGIQSSSTGDRDAFGNGVDILATDEIILDGRKTSTEIASSSQGSGAAGGILIRTGRLQMIGGEDTGVNIGARVFRDGDTGDIMISADKLELSNRAVISGQVFGTGQGSDIHIHGGDINIDGANAFAFISTTTFGSGAAGNIYIDATNLKITGGANTFVGIATQRSGPDGINFDAINPDIIVDPGTTFASNSGDINIHVTDSLEIANGAEISSATFFGSGHAGEIDISARAVSVSGIDSFGARSAIVASSENSASGAGAGIRIVADSMSLSDLGFAGAFSNSAGDSGSMSINVDDLTINNGAYVATSSSGLGKAGNIQIAANNILLRGIGSSVSAFSSINATGAGTIKLDTGNLEVYDGAAIISSTFGAGQGGNIDIAAAHVKVSGSSDVLRRSSAIVTQSVNPPDQAATGDGGNITIRADRIDVDDGGLISTASISDGNAGNIKLVGRYLNLDEGRVNAFTDHTDGGNIDLAMSDAVYLFDSQVSTRVGGAGNGGNISVTPTFMVMDNSVISANAVLGNGGNILIAAEHFFKSPTNTISASSELGIDGDIVIDSPEVDIISSIALLPSDFVDAASLLVTPCAQRSATDVSRFVVRRSDMLSDSPYALRVYNSGSNKIDRRFPNGSLPVNEGCGRDEGR